MVNIVIKELQMVFLTSTVINSNGNMKELERKIKGIVTDSNSIFLWHESEDINKKSLFPKFQLILSSNFQVMHDYVCFIAPIDYCVK